DDIHDADLLVIDAGDPFAPEITPLTEIGDRPENRDSAKHDDDEGPQQNGLVIGNRLERQSSEDELLQVEVREHAIALAYLLYADAPTGLLGAVLTLS